MNNAEIMRPLEDFVSKSAHLNYRGVSLGESLKVPLFSYLRLRWKCSALPLRLLQHTVSRMAAILYRLMFGSMHTPIDLDRIAQSKDSSKIIVICDHPGHCQQMMSGLTSAFDKEDLILITSSVQIHKALRSQFPYCLCVSVITKRFHWGRVPSYWRHLSAFRSATKTKDIHFIVHLLPVIGALLHTIDFYHQLFDSVGASAVMTLSDRHWHEYVATSVARQAGIRTYTNQHGEFVDLPLYVPIASDRIFVWGEEYRRYLVANGVPSEQVVVVGNAKFDEVYSTSEERRKKIREKVSKLLGLKDDRLTVTLLGSGFSPVSEAPRQSERDIFESYCKVCDPAVNRVIRLHPRDDLAAYRAWADGLGPSGDVIFSQSDDLYEVLSVTDIAVTFLSTTGLEALGFGIPVLIINFIEGIDVADFVTFTKDVIACRTRDEFSSTLASLIHQPDRLHAEVKRISNMRESYLSNARHGNASMVIRDFIAASGSGGIDEARATTPSITVRQA